MFNDFFYYRKSDRRAILVLAAGALVALGIIIGKAPFSSQDKADKSADKQALAQQQTSQTEFANSVKDSSASTSAKDGQKAEFQVFEPNTVSYEALVSMGISEKKALTFINYRNAGKVFREPDDLLDTYGWTQEDLAPLLPYLRIAPTYQRQRSHTASANSADRYSERYANSDDRYSERYRERKETTDSANTRPQYNRNKFKTLTLVDPNTADTTLLQRIPGIGSYYSRSIVRLRERLGGITHLEQLFEINNFPPEALEWFELSAQPAVRKLNINKTSFKQLAAHPYVGYEQTKAIQNYIRLYGPISSLEQLRSTHIFTEEELNRLIPYLDF